jgi:hypothetical protein
VQAKRDTESSDFCYFWIPAFAGMTILKLFSLIATQSLRWNDTFNEIVERRK